MYPGGGGGGGGEMYPVPQSAIPANTRFCLNVKPLLGQRRRWWPNNGITLDHRIIFARMSPIRTSIEYKIIDICTAPFQNWTNIFHIGPSLVDM